MSEEVTKLQAEKEASLGHQQEAHGSEMREATNLRVYPP